MGREERDWSVTSPSPCVVVGVGGRKVAGRSSFFIVVCRGCGASLTIGRRSTTRFSRRYRSQVAAARPGLASGPLAPAFSGPLRKQLGVQGGKQALTEAVSFTIATTYQDYGPASNSTI